MNPDSVELDLRFPGMASPPCLCPGVLDGSLPFGIWVCDADGGSRNLDPSLLHFLPGAAEILAGSGISAPLPGSAGQGTAAPASARPTQAGEEAAIEAVAAAFTAAELESMSEKWRACLREGRQWEHEFLVKTKDGRIRHLMSRGIPVGKASGEALTWVGINLDITGMKDAEEELRQSQERFRVALESGCDLLYECDLATGARRWFGPVDELLGFGIYGFPRTEPAWEDALHLEDKEMVLDGRKRQLEGRAPFHMEYRIKRRDGEYLHWLDRGKVMRDRSGTPHLWIGFVTDMTDRRRAEEMLRKSEERRRMSQRLEVIGRLAGGIAHDFNNLLTAVNGYSELVLAQLGDESDLAPHMREILRAGERAATLTRQLLAFSRRQVLAPKVLDLNCVVRDMRKMLGEFMGPNIEIRFQPGAQISRIKADPAQVEQVVLNLALNAKDAMSQGGRLLIETDNAEIQPGEFPADPVDGEPRPGPYVLLSVQDSGVGMDEETKSHIFEPFYTTKGRAQGLGLSAVYGIIKQSGGHISVTSQRGEGTILRLYWPRFEIMEPAAGGDFPLAAGSVGPGPLVLIAEDEDSQRALMRTILEGHGYTVMVAGSGQEALEMAHRARAPIDLLLADVVMPGMGGLELAQTLQNLVPKVKVLFMSGFVDHHQVRQSILECNRDFIGKPFSHGDLIAKVQSVLEARQAA
ncbi:MAG: response regulator [Fibrobacterota bacterium]|nr:response regulator [Fibrobacterota bacterium]